MKKLFFDVSHLSESDRLTVELLSNGLARRLGVDIV
jgi:hypothetical protein